MATLGLSSGATLAEGNCTYRELRHGSCAGEMTQRVEGPKARLTLSRHAVRPGGTIKVRIENHGTEDLGYGLAKTLQRYEGGRWMQLPGRPVFGVRLVVRANAVGTWQPIHIPNKSAPGRYRVRKKVTPIFSDKPKPLFLFAYFKVCQACMG
jgi:hypothetical protein